MGITNGESHPFVRILVVDDHRVFRATLTDVLRREYPKSDLIETGTIDEAWLHLRAGPMDVVFVAMRLPDGSGLQLIRELKAAHPTVPAVLLTNEEALEYRLAAAEHGASHCICKRDMTVEVICAPVQAALAAKAPPERTRLTPARMATRKSAGPVGKKKSPRARPPKRT